MRATVKLRIEPVGPSDEQLETLAQQLTSELARVRQLDTSRLELLRITPAYSPKRDAQVAVHATYFDYRTNKAVLVSAQLDGARLRSESVSFRDVDEQPLPTEEEFNRAVAILRTDRSADDARLADAFRAGHYRAYQTMPPLAEGARNRTLTVGLLPLDDSVPFVTIAVDMVEGTTTLYKVTGPAGQAACGIDSHDSRLSPNKGKAGAAWLTVMDQGTEVWKVFAVRPEATAHHSAMPPSQNGETSATSGCGIEIWSVQYKGAQVLTRAGVPIVTVKYEPTINRGPYRDWAFQESSFVAKGTKISSGFRRCSQKPETAVTSGSDKGTFRGVAVFTDQDGSLLLTSEMRAGDYRYVHSWRFYLDGTIESTFGFTVTKGKDVCHDHFHHAYWRLEFDLNGAGDNGVEETTPGAGTTPVQYEAARQRVPGRTWSFVRNSTGSGYELFPGDAAGYPDDMPARDLDDWADDPPPPHPPPADVTRSQFGEGDVWVLNYKGALAIDAQSLEPPSKQREIDDGIAFGDVTGWQKSTLDQFVDSTEALVGDRVVVWYGGHCAHSFHADEHHAEESGTPIHGHQVGLVLKPVI